MNVFVPDSPFSVGLLRGHVYECAGQTVQQPLDRPAKPEPRHPGESQDDKVVPLVPRRRAEPERMPDPPEDEDDDDPGPAAA